METNSIFTTLKSQKVLCSITKNQSQDDSMSVSSHGSAQISVIENSSQPPPIPFYNNKRTLGVRPTRTFSKGFGNQQVSSELLRKEKSRQSVEEWVRESSKIELNNSIQNLSDLPLNTEGTKDGEPNEVAPMFDLRRKDIALAKTFSSDRKTSFSTVWEEDDNTIKGFLDLPFEKNGVEKDNHIPREEDLSAFESFLNSFNMESSLKNPLDLMPIENDPMRCNPEVKYATCPPELLNLDLKSITCDLSIESYKTFWGEKVAIYIAKIKAEKKDFEGLNSSRFELSNFEQDLIGTNKNRGDDTVESLGDCEERPFDRAFLTAIPKDAEEISKVKPESDEEEEEGKSSGYSGSGEEDGGASQCAKKMHLDNQYFVQTFERRRRCTSTPLASPEKKNTPLTDYESLVASINSCKKIEYCCFK